MKFAGNEISSVLEAKTGGGCFLTIFGLPFLLTGLFVLFLPFLGIKSSDGDPMPLFFAIPFGGIFAAVGAGLMFGRGGIRIDKRQNTIESWWGLLVPFKKTIHSIDDFRYVIITKEVRRSKNSTYTVYPVYLDPKNPREKKRLKIEEPRDMLVSRKTSEAIAKFVDFCIHDLSTGKEVIREAGTLDESIRERAERLGEEIEIPTPPTSVKSRIKPRGSMLEISIPAPGFRASLLIPVVVVGVFMSFPLFGMLLPILRDAGEDPKMKLIFGGFIGFFFVFLPLMVARGLLAKAFLGKTLVVVQKTGISVSIWKGLMSRNRRMSSDEIEELFVGGNESSSAVHVLGTYNPIIMRSDEQAISFGSHLSREEAEYIAYLIKSVLIS